MSHKRPSKSDSAEQMWFYYDISLRERMHAAGAQTQTQVLVSVNVKWLTSFRMKQLDDSNMCVQVASRWPGDAEKPKNQKAEMQQSAQANCCHTQDDSYKAFMW